MSFGAAKQQSKSLNTFCFTNLFCNKSFCRSLTNNKFMRLKKKISSEELLSDILKSSNKRCSVFYSLLNNTTKLLQDLKNNFCQHTIDDFKSFFKILRTNTPTGSQVNVSDVTKVILVILENVVPSDFYGCGKNKKIFFDLIRFVLKGMLNQHVTNEKIIYKWDLQKLHWLNFLKDDTEKSKILCQFLTWIIKNVVCSIIAVRFYVTVTKLSHESRKLYYYFKEDWQHLFDDIIRNLLQKGDIIKHDSYSLGRKLKRIYSSQSRRERRFFLRRLPVLRLILKSDTSVRIIIRYNKLCTLEKQIARNRRNMFKNLRSNANSTKFEDKYKDLFYKWKESGEPKLYFVKTDLSDAFGNVHIDKLIDILSHLHKQFQIMEKNANKKQFVAKEYRKLIADLRRPIFIRIGSCTYEWKRGLVQGMRFSPILCEIFYTDFDEQFFAEFEKSSERDISMLIRYVDDYLFVTDDIKRALVYISTLHKSGRVNLKKTLCNFSYENIEMSILLNFVGFSINTHNMEITRDEKVYSGQICYRILFNESIYYPINFLEKRIAQTTVPLNPLYFDLVINSEQTMWKNIFITLCISANKFCSILNLICCNNINYKPDILFDVYKKKVAVKMCNMIIKMIMINKPGGSKFQFCGNHLRYLAYQAISLFACNFNLCIKMFPLIKIELKKSNCLNGQWKEHYSKIDENGIGQVKASKEVCRRNELKQYFCKFNKMPKSFQTYCK